jgi:hypothetical protein
LLLCNVLSRTHNGHIKGNRDFWILEGAQVGRVPGTFGEIVVMCKLGGGVPGGVGDNLGDFVGSQWGCEGGALGM